MPDPTPFELWLGLLRDRLANGERVFLPAEGHSMWPAFRAGQMIGVVATGSDYPKVGDVVLAQAGQRLMLHRVIAVGERTLLLKGDARPAPDGWCSIEDVVARVPDIHGGPIIAWVSRVGGAPLARLTGLARRLHGRLVTVCKRSSPA